MTDHNPATRLEIARQILARADALTEEFKAHVEACREEIPDIDPQGVFSGWVLQKIAGLQVMVEAMANEIERLQVRIEQ